MDRRRLLGLMAMAWAGAGTGIAWVGLSRVNPDARLVVAAASVTGPGVAVCASWALTNGADRVAGALLVASTVTPTYFLWALNLPALVVGLVLLTLPGAVLRPRAPPVSDGSSPGRKRGGDPDRRPRAYDLRPREVPPRA